MFFSQIVLAKRGILGKIWLAGHWDKKLAKNVVQKTNIPKSVRTILNPHSPMALRLTSHLLIGVVRIFSKKTKYLLSDITEAIARLKDLSKTVSKINLPTQITQVNEDEQIISMEEVPEQVEKPLLYQEVDKFLKNVDIRDLVIDPCYDPNKLDEQEEPNYQDFFGEEADEIVGNTKFTREEISKITQGQSPKLAGRGNFASRADPTSIGEDGTPVKKRFLSDALRKDEKDLLNVHITPGSPIPIGVKTPGSAVSPKTPDSIYKTLDDGTLELQEDHINPLTNYNYDDDTGVPKDDIINQSGDFNERIDFGGMQDIDQEGEDQLQHQQPDQEDQGGDGIDMRHDDNNDYFTGPDGGIDQEDQDGIQSVQDLNTTTDTITKVATDITTTTTTGTAIEHDESDIEQTPTKITTTTTVPPTTTTTIIQKPIIKRKRRSRASSTTIKQQSKEKTVLKQPRQTLTNDHFERAVDKSNIIHSKRPWISAIRTNISRTFFKMYDSLNHLPKVVTQPEDSLLSYLRNRTLNRLMKPDQNDQVNIENEENDKYTQESLLKSIGNRLVDENNKFISPSDRKRLKQNQVALTEQDLEFIENLKTDVTENRQDSRGVKDDSIFFEQPTNTEKDNEFYSFKNSTKLKSTSNDQPLLHGEKYGIETQILLDEINGTLVISPQERRVAGRGVTEGDEEMEEESSSDQEEKEREREAIREANRREEEKLKEYYSRLNLQSRTAPQIRSPSVSDNEDEGEDNFLRRIREQRGDNGKGEQEVFDDRGGDLGDNAFGNDGGYEQYGGDGIDMFHDNDDGRNINILPLGDENEIPQDHFDIPAGQKPDTLDTLKTPEKIVLSQKSANMHNILNEHFKSGPTINFLADIIDPLAAKKTTTVPVKYAAACYFYELLVLKNKTLIDLKQSEPSDDIKITKTARFSKTKDFQVIKNYVG